MYRGSFVAIVIPAYNEANHIRLVLTGMPSYVDTVYVVDDASTDSTAALVNEWLRSAWHLAPGTWHLATDSSPSIESTRSTAVSYTHLTLPTN